MANIQVRRTDTNTFEVEVAEGGGRTKHAVTATAEELRRYGGESEPERLIRESFAFLLEREPKESILRSFELSEIERYFPEYAEQIRSRLA